MKSFLSILLVALMFSLVVSPIQAKCNAACQNKKAVQKAKDKLAQKYLQEKKQYTINMIGANNKAVREAKAEAKTYYKTATQEEKEYRQAQIAAVESNAQAGNEFQKALELRRKQKIKQVFGQ